MPVDRAPVPLGSEAPPVTLFVDANVFLRLLTNDVPEQAKAADVLLAQAERGEVRLFSSVLVVAEVVWTPRSFYKRSKEQVRETVLALCHTPGLEVEDADGLVQAARMACRFMSILLMLITQPGCGRVASRK